MTGKRRENLMIQEAEPRHCSAVRKYIQDMAFFEKMPDGPQISDLQLKQDAFESSRRWIQMLVVIDNNEQDEVNCTNNVVGYLTFNFVYSLWHGRTIFIDDIYVSERHRGCGIVTALFKKLSKIIMDQSCFDIRLVCLQWNRHASAVYEHFGFINYTEKIGWHMYRLSGDEAIQRLANKPMNVLCELELDCVTSNLMPECSENLRIIKGEVRHCDAIGDLIREMACDCSVVEDTWVLVEQLIVDGFESSTKWFELLVVEDKQNMNMAENGTLVAFLMYYFDYSTWNGRCMWIDKMYITKSHKNCKGLASSLLSAAAQVACEQQCHRIGTAFLNYDKEAATLFRNLAFQDLTEDESWQMHRLCGSEAIERLAN